jgi:hypothetical protein
MEVAPASCPFVHPNSTLCHRYVETARGDHRVLISSQPCVSVEWISDSELSCQPEGTFRVGDHNVTVIVANDTSRPRAGTVQALP